MNKIPLYSTNQLITLVITLAITLGSSALVFAQTFRWVDKEGVTHFSAQAPDPSEVHTADDSKTLKPNTNQIHEKEEYLQNRATLEEQISGAINNQRRDQLKRQLLVLDYQWYQKYDPEKAEELAKQLEAPKVRVIKNQDDTNKMTRYKAFY